MTITISRSRMYAAAAMFLWAAAAALVALDLDDDVLGGLSRAAIILSVPGATLTVLAWLEAHVTTIAVAFKAGCDTEQLKQDDDRTRTSQWN